MRRIPPFLSVCLLLSVLLFSGCTVRRDTPMPASGSAGAGAEAAVRWQAFEERSRRAVSPSVLGGSLRFGPASDTRRVTWLLWGNGGQPFRLDIQAGVGTTAARAQVEDDTILLYLPQDARAYIGTDEPDKALGRLGLPMPLSLSGMALYMEGRYAEALGTSAPEAYRPSEKGSGIVYTLSDPRGQSELELAPGGLPTIWKAPGGWTVVMSYDDEGLPRKVEGRLDAAKTVREDLAGYRMILLIRTRQASAPFPAEELNLPLPAGTPVFSLDD